MLTQYVQAFDLRWLLEDSDLPAGTPTEDIRGTHTYFKKHEEENELPHDAKALEEHYDSHEIENIWRQHDTLQGVNSVLSKTSPKTTDDGFLFPQEIPDEGKTVHEISPVSEQELQRIFASDGTEGTDADSSLSSDTVFSSSRGEGSPFEIEDGFGEGNESLPSDAPVTISQLVLSTKSQLFELCDKLGIDAAGTKKDIIERLKKYYWDEYKTRVNLNK